MIFRRVLTNKSINKSATGKSFFLKFIIVAGIFSMACTTRVSEWVLLNSVPSEYTLIYFHNTGQSQGINQSYTPVQEIIQDANLRFRSVVKEDVSQSYYALYYKNRLFSTYNNTSELKNLSTSALRTRIANELMNGKLCVMLYLKTDNTVKDDKGLQILQKTLETSPFKDIITVIELSRNTTEEAHFASMLLNVEDDLKDIKEPMLFGIFGRLKALEPLLAGGITGENINYMIDYLTAECSCLIKDELPGTDILFAGNWENPKPALLNNIIDEITTLSR